MGGNVADHDPITGSGLGGSLGSGVLESEPSGIDVDIDQGLEPAMDTSEHLQSTHLAPYWQHLVRTRQGV